MTPPFNILLTNDSTVYGGGEFFVFSLAKALLQNNHNVWVACKPDNLLYEKCQREKIQVIPVDFPSRGKLFSHINILKNILRGKNIQIIHSNTNYDRTAGAFAALLTNVAHVTNVHSFHSLQHNLTHWFRNRFAIDYFIVDGICVKDLLIRKDNIPASKVSVVYLGVAPETMKTDLSLRKKIRQEFQFNDDNIVIGNVGRLVPFKGQEYLLEAFSEILKSHFNARLLLIGDGELRKSLEEKAEKLGVSGKVVFAGFRDDLTAIYSAFDIYVHSSVEWGGETFPFAVLQALAHELPVVVTRVGDVPAMVEEGTNGFIVQYGDAHAIAEKVITLAADKDMCRRFGQQSRSILLKRFTIKKMTENIEQIYKSVLAEKYANNSRK